MDIKEDEKGKDGWVIRNQVKNTRIFIIFYKDIMFSKIYNKLGFSLIELMISITILSIVLLSLVPLMITVTGLNRSISLEIKARQLATQRIEEMKAWTYDDIQKCLGNNTTCSGTEGVIETDWGVNFSRSWSINQIQTNTSSYPSPFVFTSVVQYSYKGQDKTKVFTALWGY